MIDFERFINFYPDCTTNENGSLHSNNADLDKVNQIYIAESIPKQYFEQHQVQNVSKLCECWFHLRSILILKRNKNFAYCLNSSNYKNKEVTYGIQVRVLAEKHNGTIGKDEVAKNSGHSYRYSGPKKPPFTYTELIEHALSEKGELTVSGIYQWIS